MLDNKYYFDYSKNHPEPLFDPYYEKNMVVITPDINEENDLIINNNRLIDLITAFQVSMSMGKNKDDDQVIEIIEEIIQILNKTKNINFSSFCQYFMVQNSSYSTYSSLKKDEKLDYIYEMLLRYCKERHDIYKSHGYSNTILQVISDSYSHKRNSKTSIIKFIDILAPYTTYHLQDENLILSDDNYFFLPDKSDKKCFLRLLNELDIKMESRNIEQGKVPDIVLKHNGHYYIFELKMMKGSGGGQNKQAVEFAYFIRFSEADNNIHYGIMLDSLYSNDLFSSDQPKIAEQRNDVMNALDNNPSNYFVNTAGAELLLKNIFEGI